MGVGSRVVKSGAFAGSGEGAAKSFVIGMDAVSAVILRAVSIGGGIAWVVSGGFSRAAVPAGRDTREAPSRACERTVARPGTSHHQCACAARLTRYFQCLPGGATEPVFVLHSLPAGSASFFCTVPQPVAPDMMRVAGTKNIFFLVIAPPAAASSPIKPFD